MTPLCFVLMPFGKKPTSDGRLVDFDAVYRQLIHPAICAAGLQALRADEEQVGGVIHKAMFERLILCEFAVADLTSANANVFYELGLRHAVRPHATQLLFAQGWGQLPFDVNLLRALPYTLDASGAPDPAALAGEVAALSQKLRDARHAEADSPVYQLLEGFPDIARLKTDVFRERVDYAETLKTALAQARASHQLAAIDQVAAQLGDVALADAGVVVDVLLSYRALSAWAQMVDWVGKMSPPLRASTLVREQLGLALNRAGRSEEAERVLLDVIKQRGASSETCGILGRVYKDRWQARLGEGRAIEAAGVLRKAIAEYLRGFEADWRDAYPGVNAVTLMEMQETPDPRQAELLPVVRYAVARRMASGQPDYWDYATQLELAVLARDIIGAQTALADALARRREPWEGETTAKNLQFIIDARHPRGEDCGWMHALVAALRA